MAVVAALMIACEASPQGSPATPTPTSGKTAAAADFAPAEGAEVIPGGCNGTKVYRGPIPPSLDSAAGHNSPHSPYVIADPPIAAGFLFKYPLKGGFPGPNESTNKILWVVKDRKRSYFSIDGHPHGANRPIVHFSRPADSGPGEIYPDGEDVPTPGCWDFTLKWAGLVAHVSLEYGP